jgi:hypothetical protein
MVVRQRRYSKEELYYYNFSEKVALIIHIGKAYSLVPAETKA